MRSEEVVIVIDDLGMPTDTDVSLIFEAQCDVSLDDTQSVTEARGAEKAIKDESPFSVVSFCCSEAEDSEFEHAPEICCRICMETIKNVEFEDQSALRLGCKCLDGLDVVHLSCAQKWFRLKKSLSCEICGFPAENLPERFKKKLQRRIDQVNQVGFRSDDSDAVERFTLLETRQPAPWAVFLYGFLPTLASFVILMSFFDQYMEIGIGTSGVLSTALALITFIHFLIERDQHLWHLLFVMSYLSTIVSITAVFYLFYEWEAIPAAIGGALIGPVTATGFFAALKTSLLLCSPGYQIWRSATI